MLLALVRKLTKLADLFFLVVEEFNIPGNNQFNTKK